MSVRVIRIDDLDPNDPRRWTKPTAPSHMTGTKKLAEEVSKVEDPSSDNGMASTTNGQRNSESKLPEANVPKSKKKKKKKKKKKVREGPNQEEDSDSDSPYDDCLLGRLKRRPFVPPTKPTPEEVAELFAKFNPHREAKLAELCKFLGHEYPPHDDTENQEPFLQPITSDSDIEDELWEDIVAQSRKHPNSYSKY